MLGRTAHIDTWGEVFVRNVRMRVKRGVGTSSDPDDEPPSIYLRCVKDNASATRKVRKSLGRPGDTAMTIEFGAMGVANTWQFEWETADNCPVEIVSIDAKVEPVNRGR
jgi:hypothetical protein